MNTDINPYRSLSADITPTEFEIFCMETLRAYAKQEGLQQFRLNHNKKITADDGTYQIDIFAEYVALGTKNTLIVECKKHSRAIEREIVAALYTKVQSIGANKGLLISTTGFQTGATQFAQKHGITLWQICDNQIKHIKNSACKKNSEAEMFQFAVEHFLPKYFLPKYSRASLSAASSAADPHAVRPDTMQTANRTAAIFLNLFIFFSPSFL